MCGVLSIAPCYILCVIYCMHGLYHVMSVVYIIRGISFFLSSRYFVYFIICSGCLSCKVADPLLSKRPISVYKNIIIDLPFI